MKYLNDTGLETLVGAIKGDMSSLTGTIVPTFEEVYTNLSQLDEAIDTHTDKEVTDATGAHGIRYNNSSLEYYDNGWNPLVVDATQQSAIHYGVKINKNDSNPATRMEYMYDCVGFTPAHMDYANGEFDYGSWGNAFFIQNNYPAMVTYAGGEDYKLDPNDHTKKVDGTASDVTNVNYGGNAMSVFDCKIWLYLHQDSNYEYIEVSNKKLNDNFYDYGYDRGDGTHAEKLYYPMFGGYKDGSGRLRSIAGVNIWNNTGGTQNEINAATANGPNWQILDYAHRIVINSLLTLIGCNDDSQAAFGQGQTSGYVNNSGQNYGHLVTGTMKDKGQFFGYSDTSHEVKVFFIEKWWGNNWDRCLGLINANGVYKYKLIPPYNLSGDGYYVAGNVPGSEWQKDTSTSHFGRLPKTTGSGGSSSTYNCDYFWSNNSQVDIALWGGTCINGDYCGASSLSLNAVASYSDWGVGASVYLVQP